MTALRTIAAYAEALTKLMPRGRAWPEGGGAIWARLMLALAPEFRRADQRALKLLDEADPRTCAETLPDWERVLGLPDPCTPGDATFNERRDAVVALLRFAGGASIAYFVSLADRLGYAIEVTEYRPFACARSSCGHQLEPRRIGSPTMRFVWTVALGNRRLRYFQVGIGGSQTGIDPHLKIERATDLECLIARLKPAHTVVVFDYSDAA